MRARRGVESALVRAARAMTSTRMSTSIIALEASGEPEVSSPAPERLLEGRPTQRVWNAFVDGTEQFFCGRWSSSRGKWRVRYSENELCVMTAGRVVIESATGERHSFAAGDAFVVPAGFQGTWTVLEDCSKIYAIFESRSAQG
jgi:uncharacterized protein